MKKWLASSTFVLGAAALTSVASAASLAYEAFDYDSGSSIGGLSGGTGWNAGWLGGGPLSISENGLSYGTLPVAGRAMGGLFQLRDVRREFNPFTGRIWMSALVRWNTNPSGSFFEFKTMEPGNVNRAAQFGVANGELFTNHDFGGARRTAPFTPVVGETYFFVFTYNSSGQAPTAVYVNPNLGGVAPSGEVAAAIFNGQNWGLSSIGGFRLYADRPNITLDEIRVGTTFSDVAPGVNITGKLTLEAYPLGKVAGLVAEFTTIKNGVESAPIPVVLGAEGAYSLPVTETGTFDVRVKVRNWLSARANGVTVGGAVDLSLLNGDVDEDNSVTVFDYDALSAAFDATPADSNWNVNADLDGDDSVTVFDYDLLSANFDKAGN